MKTRRLAGLIGFAVLSATVLAGGVAVFYLGPGRERQFASADLAALRQQAAAQPSLSQDPIFLYHLGRRLNAGGDFAEASAVMEQAAGLEPNTARIRDEWARSLVGSGNPSAAYAQLMQYAGTNPGSAGAQLLLGKFHASQGAHPAAVRSLEQSVALDPKSAEAWSWLAQSRLKLGLNEAAEEALRQALRLRPDGEGAAPDYLQYAVLRSAGDSAGALTAFRKAIELAPRNAEARREYARFLLTRAEYDAAADECRRAVEINPEDAVAYLLLGRALIEQGVGYEAIPALEKAAHLAPEDPLPARELTRLYRRMGTPDREAQWKAESARRGGLTAERKTLTEQLRARPGDVALRRRMAEILARSGDVEGCIRESALALKVAPDAPRALTAAGRLLVKVERPREALPILRRVGAEQVNNFEIFEAWGDALLQLGRFHEAAVQYQRVSDVLTPERVRAFQKRIAAAQAERAARKLPTDGKLKEAQAALKSGDAMGAEAKAEESVALDGENTTALRFLMECKFFRRADDPMARVAARRTAERLATLSPEDGVSRAFLAILLQEEMSSPPDPARITDLVAGAEYDPAASGANWYARGLLALRQGNAASAREDFAEAARRDPRFARKPGQNLSPDLTGGR